MILAKNWLSSSPLTDNENNGIDEGLEEHRNEGEQDEKDADQDYKYQDETDTNQDRDGAENDDGDKAGDFATAPPAVKSAMLECGSTTCKHDRAEIPMGRRM